MRRQGTEHHRDAASLEAKAFLAPSSQPKPMRCWPEAKTIFEALPKETRRPINQRFKQARAEGRAQIFAHFVIAELVDLGLMQA